MDPRRYLPSVDQLLRRDDLAPLQEEYGRKLFLQAAQELLDELRNDQDLAEHVDHLDFPSRLQNKLESWTRISIEPVINATGVILHTNLGRAPLSQATIQAMEIAARQYNTLEFDLGSGKRGSRSVHASQLLSKLTGAEDALVVNNNASAVLLVLTALAKRKRVVVARSQLVEIGGGFRIPEVLKQSGAKLEEIGTTNRVHQADYREALSSGAEFVLHTHSSNFKIIGFTEEPPAEDVIREAHQHGAIYIDDLGSGALLDTAQFGMAHEPMVQESVQAGADIICFSGDKLLGGPQAGIILGRKELLGRIKNHPLYRALRTDKVCLAGLSATLLHYLKGEAVTAIPTWRMISASMGEIEERAIRWQKALGIGAVLASTSTVGGGSLPGETLPTRVLALSVKNPGQFLSDLRRLTPAVIARIEDEKVCFDPRTVFLDQEDPLLANLHLIMQKYPVHP